MPSETAPPEPTTKETMQTTALSFLSGIGAGLILFALFAGVWNVNHFWWVMVAVSLSCGGLAVVLRQKNVETLLTALLDNAPWL